MKGPASGEVPGVRPIRRSSAASSWPTRPAVSSPSTRDASLPTISTDASGHHPEGPPRAQARDGEGVLARTRPPHAVVTPTTAQTPPWPTASSPSIHETLLRHIHQINERHPWSHNDHYHPWLLRRLPRHVERALDVGCGTGNLLQALAAKADLVVGVDPDPVMVATARRRTAHLPHVRVLEDSLLDLPDGTYDAVTAVAVVHHTDLEQALTALHRATTPGGRVLIVGCYRATTLFDYLTDVVAIPANVLVGLLRSRGAGRARLAISAPTATPSTSLREVRAVATRILPGARIRRRLFWRYTLDYRNP